MKFLPLLLCVLAVAMVASAKSLRKNKKVKSSGVHLGPGLHREKRSFEVFNELGELFF